MIGKLIVKRVEDTPNDEATEFNVEIANLTLVIARKEKIKKLELKEKYEQFLDAYNKEVQKRIELKNKMVGYKGQSSKPRVSYPPCPPIAPFNIVPLIETPGTPQRLQACTTEELEEERNKIWPLHVELGVHMKIKRLHYVSGR